MANGDNSRFKTALARSAGERGNLSEADRKHMASAWKKMPIGNKTALARSAGERGNLSEADRKRMMSKGGR